MAKSKIEEVRIYPLPDGMHVIYAANSILPFGPVNFIWDEKNPRAGCWANKGPFFATAHRWMQPHEFLVSGCLSLEELEQQAYSKVQEADWENVGKAFYGNPSNKLVEAIFTQATTSARKQNPREYFQTVGQYFVDISKFLKQVEAAKFP